MRQFSDFLELQSNRICVVSRSGRGKSGGRGGLSRVVKNVAIAARNGRSLRREKSLRSPREMRVYLNQI
jgi:hypothetical protein